MRLEQSGGQDANFQSLWSKCSAKSAISVRAVPMGHVVDQVFASVSFRVGPSFGFVTTSAGWIEGGKPLDLNSWRIGSCHRIPRVILLSGRLRQGSKLFVKASAPLNLSEFPKQIRDHFEHTLQVSVRSMSLPILEAAREQPRKISIRVASKKSLLTSSPCLSENFRAAPSLSLNKSAQVTLPGRLITERVYGSRGALVALSMLSLLPFALLVHGSMRKRQRRRSHRWQAPSRRLDLRVNSEQVYATTSASACQSGSAEDSSEVSSHPRVRISRTGENSKRAYGVGACSQGLRACVTNSWLRLVGFFAKRDRHAEIDTVLHPKAKASAENATTRGTLLFDALYTDCRGSILAIRCAALSRQDPSLAEFKLDKRGDFPAFMNFLQGFPHGRLQELCEQCSRDEKKQLSEIIAEVARIHIEEFLSTIHEFLTERDHFRALREIDSLLRWYRNWLCPCIDEYASGNEQVTNYLRKAVIPAQKWEKQNMLVEAYRLYLSRMYRSTVFAHMIAYEARNLAALRSLFGLGWSQIKEIEEAAAAEVWRAAIDKSLSVDSETEVRSRRAGIAFNFPLHEPNTRKRLREMRRFLVAVLGEERAISALARAATPIVQEEAIRVLVSRRFPEDIEIQRLVLLAACLDCDVLDAIRRAGHILGIGQSTRIKVLVHVASRRANADISSLSLEL